MREMKCTVGERDGERTFGHFSAVELYFRWAIDGDGQCAGAGVHRVDQELARMACFALIQTGA